MTRRCSRCSPRSGWNTRVYLVTALGLCCASSLGNAVAQPVEPTSDPKPEVDDLGERLKRKAITDSDEDLMSEIIRLMNEASRRLGLELDAGEGTQATQGAILKKIDEAIQHAAQNRRRKKSSASQSSSDKRVMPKRTARSEPAPAGKDDDAQDSASTKAADEGGDPRVGPAGALDGGRRTWGNLPRREREEVIQGRGEAYLERYRKMIERYYRALQESQQTP